MKAFKFLGMLFAAFALSFTATSCGSDDADEIIEDYENGKYTPTADIKKSDSELVLTIKYPKLCTETYTAKFSKKVCTSYVCKSVFASNELADIAWAEAKEAEEEGYKVKRDGKTITIDMTEDMKDMEYDMVLRIMEEEKREIEHLYNESSTTGK